MAEQRLRIGIVVTNLPTDKVGGAQQQAARMARELAKVHDVTLFSRGDATSMNDLNLRDARFVLRRPFPLPWIRLFVDARIAARQIREAAPFDALICHQTLGAGLVGAMIRPLGIPFLVYVHGRVEYAMDRLNKYRFFSPRVFRAADRVVVLDPVLKKELLDAFDGARFAALRRRLEERVRVIPNGIDLRPMRRGSGRYVLYVGRLVRLKGVDDLLSAMRTLPRVELTIVGDGPERARLQRVAKGLPVTWVGRATHDEVMQLMDDAMCLVLPSHTEMLPMVVLEAMAMGVPVVATPVGGVPTLVESGVNGNLVPVGEPEALARAIAGLVESPATREAMGRRARERASQYTWPIVAKILVDEIRQLAREPHR